jgi:hypothetical protein
VVGAAAARVTPIAVNVSGALPRNSCRLRAGLADKPAEPWRRRRTSPESQRYGRFVKTQTGREMTASPPPPQTGVPGASPQAAAAPAVTLPVCAQDSTTGGNSAGSRPTRSISPVCQHLWRTSKSPKPEASETSVHSSPVRQKRI